MLQNIMAGFDILGVGVVLGSLALLWGFLKVLHDDLDLTGTPHTGTESKPNPASETGEAGRKVGAEKADTTDRLAGPTAA